MTLASRARRPLLLLLLLLLSVALPARDSAAPRGVASLPTCGDSRV